MIPYRPLEVGWVCTQYAQDMCSGGELCPRRRRKFDYVSPSAPTPWNSAALTALPSQQRVRRTLSCLAINEDRFHDQIVHDCHVAFIRHRFAGNAAISMEREHVSPSHQCHFDDNRTRARPTRWSAIPCARQFRGQSVAHADLRLPSHHSGTCPKAG